MKRSRTFTWSDPSLGAAQAKTLSGQAYLDAMSAGTIDFPPLLHTLDFKVEGVTAGQATFSFQPQEFHYNPIGSVHGGVITAMLDSAMGCSLHSLLDAGVGYTTLEIKVNFLKAVTTQTGELRAIGKVIHAGNRTALTEAQLIDGQGKVYAHGTSTCMILR